MSGTGVILTRHAGTDRDHGTSGAPARVSRTIRADARGADADRLLRAASMRTDRIDGGRPAHGTADTTD
jgi:hypothetical protein